MLVANYSCLRTQLFAAVQSPGLLYPICLSLVTSDVHFMEIILVQPNLICTCESYDFFDSVSSFVKAGSDECWLVGVTT